MKRHISMAVVALCLFLAQSGVAQANGSYGFGVGVGVGVNFSFSGGCNKQPAPCPSYGCPMPGMMPPMMPGMMPGYDMGYGGWGAPMGYDMGHGGWGGYGMPMDQGQFGGYGNYAMPQYGAGQMMPYGATMPPGGPGEMPMIKDGTPKK